MLELIIGVGILLLVPGYIWYVWYETRERGAGRLRDCPMCRRQIHAPAEDLDRLYEDWEIVTQERIRRAEAAQRSAQD
jgi:hypothetical protein